MLVLTVGLLDARLAAEKKILAHTATGPHIDDVETSVRITEVMDRVVPVHLMRQTLINLSNKEIIMKILVGIVKVIKFALQAIDWIVIGPIIILVHVIGAISCIPNWLRHRR